MTQQTRVPGATVEYLRAIARGDHEKALAWNTRLGRDGRSSARICGRDACAAGGRRGSLELERLLRRNQRRGWLPVPGSYLERHGYALFPRHWLRGHSRSVRYPEPRLVHGRSNVGHRSARRNWQAGWWLAGIEADIDCANITGVTDLTAGGAGTVFIPPPILGTKTLDRPPPPPGPPGCDPHHTLPPTSPA